MRLPRLTTRRLMVVAAIAAELLIGGACGSATGAGQVADPQRTKVRNPSPENPRSVTPPNLRGSRQETMHPSPQSEPVEITTNRGEGWAKSTRRFTRASLRRVANAGRALGRSFDRL